MKKLLPLLIATLLLAILVGFLASMPAENATAAPVAAPTPVAAVDRGGAEPVLFNLFTNRAIAADTTSTCVEVTRHDVADIYYDVTVDGAAINTTTLTLQFGNSETALVDGINVEATIVTDTTGLVQAQTFGRYMCILANVATTDTVTVTVNALAK